MDRIARAFLFHEDLATQDEGASLDEALEHVLWYYPAEASRPERVKHVGLAQALLSFGDRFHHHQQQQRRRRRRRRQHEKGASGGGGGEEEEAREWSGVPPGKVEVVRTRRHCHGFLECEPGVWLVMVLVSRRRQQQQQKRENDGNPKASRPSTRSLLRSAVFGRGIGASPPPAVATTDPRGYGSRADGRVDAAVRSPSPPARDRSPSSPAAVRSVRNDGVGGGGGGPGDWVDETALHAAMGTAYRTFALMHGPVSSALDAPAALSPSREGAGGGGDINVPGLEVLRRLASARKRVRKAKKEALDLVEHAACSREAGGIGQEGDSVESHRQELLESRVRLEEREVAVLLRASPAEVLRETLEDFFSTYLPGAGLAEPHFHLDMGYPQSLPMDPYRRQLGLRIQRRVRQRIRSLLLSSGIDVEVDFAMTLAGGALLLACKDPQPVAAAAAGVGHNNTADVKKASTRNGCEDGRQTNGGGVDKTSGGGTGGKEAGDGVIAPGRDTASAGSEEQTAGEPVGDESRDGKPQQQQQQQQQQSGGGAVLSGKEATLLVGYLRAAALTATETRRAQEGAVAAGQSPPPTVPPLGEESGSKEGGGGEESPPMSLWAAFRSGISSNDDDDDNAGAKRSGGGSVRPARPPPATGAGGLLRRDGSLASCDEASSVLRHRG
ncbi:unnamed protein product, partial [Ectocarpus fasciculatus]